MSGAESAIVERIVAYLRSLPNGHARKVHGSVYGTTGEPDVDAVVGGRSVKLEVKRPGHEDELKPIQRVALNRWRSAGCVVGIVTSVEDVRVLLAYEVDRLHHETHDARMAGAQIAARTDRLLTIVRTPDEQ